MPIDTMDLMQFMQLLEARLKALSKTISKAKKEQKETERRLTLIENKLGITPGEQK